uniref:(northern house mosquito) hypothetical protein n=1 Tax=Culex pipiens TaxID=7175 RepID=A0A8D8AFQ4_CULPI
MQGLDRPPPASGRSSERFGRYVHVHGDLHHGTIYSNHAVGTDRHGPVTEELSLLYLQGIGRGPRQRDPGLESDAHRRAGLCSVHPERVCPARVHEADGSWTKVRNQALWILRDAYAACGKVLCVLGPRSGHLHHSAGVRTHVACEV